MSDSTSEDPTLRQRLRALVGSHESRGIALEGMQDQGVSYSTTTVQIFMQR